MFGVVMAAARRASIACLGLGLGLGAPARAATPSPGEADHEPSSIDLRDPSTPGSQTPDGVTHDGGPDGGLMPQNEVERRVLARKLHDRAKDRYVEGRYREALDKLTTAVQLDSQDKDLHYVLAFVAEKLLELDLALEHYHASADLEPNPVEKQRLSNVIRRVERARDHLKQHPNDARLPRQGAAAGPASAPGPSPLRVGAYVTAGIGGTAALVAAIAGAYSLYMQPDADGWTGTSAQIDRLNSDAHRAYASGMVAEIAGALGAVSLATALVLAIADPSTAAPAASSPTSARWRAVSPGGPAIFRF